nr:hypothetical protein [Tanacetum cinerariifolium]
MSCPSDLGGIVRGRGNSSFGRLAGSRRIRVGSWNVGSLTHKLFELEDALGRHKVDIACFQETRWKGSRAREGNGYKLWYSRSSIARNGVGIILARRLKDNVVHVTRRRGDLNDHISDAADGYAEVNGGFGFEDRNEESRGHNTQIEYLLVRRGDLKACKDCRVFLGETCSSQHRLIIVDVLLERLRHKREATRRPRILWKNLNEEAVDTFRATVFERLAVEDMSVSNADQMWNTLELVMKDTEKDSLGVASARTHLTHRESWWFCEEVQTKVATKQFRFKELLSCSEGNQEDIDRAKERYKAAKREANLAAAKVKDKAYEDLYKNSDSREGVNDIYKIAKARGRRIRDIGNVKYIKDEGGRTIRRPKGSEEVGCSSPPMHFDCYYLRINHREVRAALPKMGRNKAVGPD